MWSNRPVTKKCALRRRESVHVIHWIGSYCVKNTKTNCNACLEFSVTGMKLLIEICNVILTDSMYVYIEEINRGGLKYPAERIIMTKSEIYVLFK